MTEKQNIFVNELLTALPQDEKKCYEQIVSYLVELGYIPQKQKVKNLDLSFKHLLNGKVIAKIGVKKQRSCLRLKFFACKDVPEKFLKALYDETVANEGQYSKPVPPADNEPVLCNAIMKKCTLSCGICTGGNMRYYYQFPDGKTIFRCGAYPVFIPDITENDLDDLKRLISEQHRYFLSLAQ